MAAGTTEDSGRPARVWLVTGAGSGIGYELCRAVLDTGGRVVATARDTNRLTALLDAHPDRCRAVRLDVTDPRSIERAVEEALEQAGQIDVLVNNAGWNRIGAIGDIAPDIARAIFETNFFGPLALIRQLLPHFIRRGSGHIVNMSSIAGVRGMPAFGLYSASKFALEGLSEALLGEVGELGIGVTIVEPGPYKTEFRDRSLSDAGVTAAYQPTVGRIIDGLNADDGLSSGDPREAANSIVRAVDAQSPPLRLPLGQSAANVLRERIASLEKTLAMVSPPSA